MRKPSFNVLEPSEKDKALYEHYKKSGFFKKTDIILLSVVAAIVIILCVFCFTGGNGNYAEVYFNGSLLATYQLNTDTVDTIKIDDTEIEITVKDGKIAVTKNDCHNQSCVKTGFIGKVGERIVCAPHKLTIVVRGDSKDGYDAVTGGGGA